MIKKKKKKKLACAVIVPGQLNPAMHVNVVFKLYTNMKYLFSILKLFTNTITRHVDNNSPKQEWGKE
jgi:hypothetical protein